MIDHFTVNLPALVADIDYLCAKARDFDEIRGEELGRLKEYLLLSSLSRALGTRVDFERERVDNYLCEVYFKQYEEMLVRPLQENLIQGYHFYGDTPCLVFAQINRTLVDITVED